MRVETKLIAKKRAALQRKGEVPTRRKVLASVADRLRALVPLLSERDSKVLLMYATALKEIEDLRDNSDTLQSEKDDLQKKIEDLEDTVRRLARKAGEPPILPTTVVEHSNPWD